jgi:hypothetical protein
MDSAVASASVRRRNVSQIYFPLRRTWARQLSEGSLRITGIRVQSKLNSCAQGVQNGTALCVKILFNKLSRPFAYLNPYWIERSMICLNFTNLHTVEPLAQHAGNQNAMSFPCNRT